MSVKSPVSSRYAAAMYQAQALRFYSRYVEARKSANFHGGDFQGPQYLPHPADVEGQYLAVLHEGLHEQPTTAADALAAIELVGIIAIDRILYAVNREGAVVGEEEDAFHQAILISSIWPWINKLDLADAVAAERAARGAAPCGERKP